MHLCVIPARGGSKRIPLKNIKPFNGKPMIGWAIDIAKESGLFDKIVVSTDDDDIATVARNFGAEIPFIRPKELSDDLTPTAPVISHAAKECLELGWDFDYVCCIYPCVPFLMVDDLTSSLNLIKEKKADFIYPVTEYAHPIGRAMRYLDNGKMQFITPEFELTRTQDLEAIYHDSGQFYWGSASAWLNSKKMHTDGLGMVIPSWRVVDIDNEDDWIRAEMLFKVINFNRLK